MFPQIVAVPHNTRLQHTTNPTLLWSKRLTKKGSLQEPESQLMSLWKPVPDPDGGAGKQPSLMHVVCMKALCSDDL